MKRRCDEESFSNIGVGGFSITTANGSDGDIALVPSGDDVSVGDDITISFGEEKLASINKSKRKIGGVKGRVIGL